MICRLTRFSGQVIEKRRIIWCDYASAFQARLFTRPPHNFSPAQLLPRCACQGAWAFYSGQLPPPPPAVAVQQACGRGWM